MIEIPTEPQRSSGFFSSRRLLLWSMQSVTLYLTRYQYNSQDHTMEEWTRDDFLAYVLIYAAKADFAEGPKETEFIRDEVGDETYEAIHSEYEEDTDAERIGKIIDYVQGEEFDKEYANMLFHEITELFMSDGEFSLMEKNLRRALQRIISM